MGLLLTVLAENGIHWGPAGQRATVTAGEEVKDKASLPIACVRVEPRYAERGRGDSIPDHQEHVEENS